MALSTQPYKGARDFYPEDKRLQNYMFNIIRKVVAGYGYAEYDAPILEPLDLYKAKTGEEIVNEQTYSFTDRGDREVAIRPEMTPTVSRMVAGRRQELAYPLRWFSIPNLWRYERPQRGRLREHWQLNVDIFGDAGLSAEHEIITVADSVLKAYGATDEMYQIRVNSRVILNELFEGYLGLNSEQALKLSKLIDRMPKMEADKFTFALNEVCGEKASKVQELLLVKSVDEFPEEILSHEAVDRLENLLNMLVDSGVASAVFDITLTRGFDYYTDIVFEVYDTDPKNNRSMFGGGRYDGLVGLFGVEPLPTVGFGMGDVTLQNFLEAHNLLPELNNETDLQIACIGNVYSQADRLANELRTSGLNVSVDATNRKIDKKIKSADKQGIKHVVIVGETEANTGKYSLKNLESGREVACAAADIPKILKG